jgi:hypothetical protein
MGLPSTSYVLKRVRREEERGSEGGRRYNHFWRGRVATYE